MSLSKINLKNIKSIIVLVNKVTVRCDRGRGGSKWLIFRDPWSPQSFIQHDIQIIFQHILYCFSSLICKMRMMKYALLGFSEDERVGACKALRTPQGTESVQNNVSYYDCCCFNTYYVPGNKNSMDIVSCIHVYNLCM